MKVVPKLMYLLEFQVRQMEKVLISLTLKKRKSNTKKLG